MFTVIYTYIFKKLHIRSILTLYYKTRYDLDLGFSYFREKSEFRNILEDGNCKIF